MSMKVLSDNGYTTVFGPHEEGVAVYHTQDIQLTSSKPPAQCTGALVCSFWHKPPLHSSDLASNVYELPSTPETVRFLHAALESPTKATLLTAILHGNLITFPGLINDSVTNFFPKSPETQKGHMRQQRQGVRSTKVLDEDAIFIYKQHPGSKHKDVYLCIFDTTKRPNYSGQTGRFPITSNKGHKQLMVAVS